MAGFAYAGNFHDVTAASPITGLANNDTFQGANPSNPGALYTTLPGYDMTTGLGSPIGSALGNSLCGALFDSASVVSPGNQLTIAGQAVSVAVHGSSADNAPFTYSAAGLPAGLSINPATGVISGTPTIGQTATVTVSVADALGKSGSTSFSWTVVVPGKPQASNARRLSGLGTRHPKLTFTVSAGSFAPALSSVTVKLPGGLSFAKKPKLLAKGLTVKAGATKVKLSAKVKRGALLITFKSAVTSATVTLVAPAISISRSEASKVRKHKVKELTVALRTTDTSNTSTSGNVSERRWKT